MENLKEVELMELTNDLSFKDSDENEENTSYIGNGEWELFYSDTKTLKAKEYIKFDTKLNTKGVYFLQFFVERAIATPGRNVTLDVRIKSLGDQIDLFQDEKILHPRFSLNKQEYNNWIMFIPVEEKFVDSLLCISYKSNALFNPIDITTIIRFFPGKDFEETMSLIEEYKDKHLNQSNKIIHQVVSLRLKKEMSTPAIYNPSTKNKSEENNEKNSKEEKKENSIDEKSTSFISSSSPTEKPTSQSFVFVEKTDSSDVENIVFENIKNEDDSYFEKKTVFEDFNCSVSNFSKYIREIPITPGVYALQLDINNKIQSPRRSLQITYKIFSHDKSNNINNNSDSKQNLIEKFSQKQILLLKKNYIFLKPEIYSSGEDCTFWLKIKSPVLIPVKVDVKLIHTKNINKSENFLSTPMRQISEVKDFINDLVPVKKNVWSVQKSLYFKRSEIFEIELTPGVYTFFICKLDNLNISIRNFKCSASLYNDRYSEEKQCISLKTITHDLQIGDGENSVSENTVEFECETNCILRINMDASPMSPPIAFYARVQKLTKFDLKTLKHEGLNWAYYLFIFLGLFVFLKYIILSINFLACFKIFGFSFEYVFLIMFAHWFYTTGQFSNLKYYQSKMDELKLKSGFEKFKMFLKHAKNGEEERKLEILNRKFSENKII